MSDNDLATNAKRDQFEKAPQPIPANLQPKPLLANAYFQMANSALAIQVGGDHYKQLAIQPVEYCQRNHLGFCESSVIKYVTRHHEKNGAEDIKKAIHFLNMLLQLEYPETSDAFTQTKR